MRLIHNSSDFRRYVQSRSYLQHPAYHLRTAVTLFLVILFFVTSLLFLLPQPPTTTSPDSLHTLHDAPQLPG